jgi:hypothetical protein
MFESDADANGGCACGSLSASIVFFGQVPLEPAESSPLVIRRPKLRVEMDKLEGIRSAGSGAREQCPRPARVLALVARVARQEVLRALQVPPRLALFQRPDIALPETETAPV